ncbi:MAG TPA: hypothetical protein PK916_09710 [Bacteroidota bacterium]|nr:hypothetical protein [Bacteroidota bacterium]
MSASVKIIYNKKSFRSWLNTKSWVEKWFIYLILLRPIIDLFYFVKEVSPILSPLYFAGVFTPIMAQLSLTAMRDVGKAVKLVDLKILGMMFVIAVAVSSLTASNIVEFSSLALLTLTPFLLVLYCVKVVRVKEDVTGILYAFALSSITAISIMIIEVILNPGSRSLGSNEIEYVRGYYADPMNYGLYANILVIAGLKSYYSRKMKTIVRIYLVVCALVLIISSHLVSLFAFLSIIAYSLTSKNSNRRNVAFVLVVLAGLIYSIYTGYYSDQSTDNQMERELEILRGERPIDQALHGRVSRWKEYMVLWEDKHVLYKMLGVPFSVYVSGLGDASLWMSRAVHSDYLRILYSVGFVGLIIYLNIVRKVFFSNYKDIDNAVLSRSIFITILLYSVTTLPLLTPLVSYLFAFGLAVYENEQIVKR